MNEEFNYEEDIMQSSQDIVIDTSCEADVETAVTPGISRTLSREDYERNLLIDQSSLFKGMKSANEIISDIDKGIEKADKLAADIKNFSAPKVDTSWKTLGLVTGGTLTTVMEDISKQWKTLTEGLSQCDQIQNGNINQVCKLVCYLALAGKGLYEKVDEMSDLDKSDAENLKQLQAEFNKSLESGNVTKESLNALIDLTARISSIENKRSHNLQFRISESEKSILELKQKLELQKKEIDSSKVDISKANSNVSNIFTKLSLIGSDIKSIQNEITILRQSLETTKEYLKKVNTEVLQKESKINNTISQQANLLAELKRNIENIDNALKVANQDILVLKKKSFFDSIFYKVSIGIISLSALAVSLYTLVM